MAVADDGSGAITWRRQAVPRALLSALLVLLASSSFAFLCLQLAPGDVGTALGEGAATASRAAVRARAGADQPFLVQYSRWLATLARGELGWSPSQHRPVAEAVRAAMGHSLQLIVPAMLLSLLGGITLGRWQGRRAGSRRDRLVSSGTLALHAMPDVVLASLVLLLGTGFLPLFPTGGITSDLYAYLPMGARLIDRGHHLVLPVLTIALIGVTTIARHQRSALREMGTASFVQALPARGLTESRVARHVARGTLPSVVSVAALQLPAWLAGIVFVEQVFAWPGMGYLLVQAISAQDVSLASGAVLAAGLSTAIAAFLGELVRGWADPRLRAETHRPSVGTTAS